MRIVSWNVNGLRAAARKGFADWFSGETADLIGLQEVRAMPDQLPEELQSPEGWHAYFNPAERRGYSGTALYSRAPLNMIDLKLGVEEMDNEGRVQLFELNDWIIANVYFPNGTGKNRDNSRIPFKLDFYERLRIAVQDAAGEDRPALVMGDWNTAHNEIDIARPKPNEKKSGFCLIERQAMDIWSDAGWTDTFRHFYPETVLYSWWSNRAGSRERNVGWRIDAAWANKKGLERVKGAGIDTEVLGSDHAPIWLEVD